MKKNMLFMCILLLSDVNVKSDEFLSRRPRYLVYPPRGAYKLVLGLAVPFPLQIPGKYVAWTINFQFQYQLPINITQIQLPGRPGLRVGRSLRHIDHFSVYTLLESYIDGRGLDGKSCVLRTICEAADIPLYHNGLIGEIMQIVLTPDMNYRHREYVEARILGENGAVCEALYPECSKSILGLVSHIEEN